MTFLSLFSGIGGFDLGLERAGMECIGQVEINPFCLRVLSKHWPHVPKIGDIHDVNKYTFGAVELICGGFPCQPFSCAGKRRGAKDDRYLWPEMLRVIKAYRPTWIIGENVAGIVNMELNTVLSDLEAQGYQCEAFIIPACAVDAPHERKRIWILGYSNNIRSRSSKNRQGNIERNDRNAQGEIKICKSQGSGGKRKVFPDPYSQRLQEQRESESTQPEHDIAQCVGEDVSDSESARRKTWESDSIRNSKSNERFTCACRWEPEPDVGRVVTRFSIKLDGGRLDAHEICKQKASAAGLPSGAAMRDVRNICECAKASQQPPKCAICGVPLSEVPHQRRQDKWEMGQWEQKDKGLYGMRYGVHELYSYESKVLREKMLIGAWQNQCTQTLASRVDRLRGLGNAVVPQIVEIIGRAILTTQERLDI